MAACKFKTKTFYFNKKLTISLGQSSQMINAFAMVQGRLYRLGVGLYGNLHSLGPVVLGYVNHVETSPS